MRQDLIRTLNAWESAVPRSDIRIVTLPGAGQPAGLLNDRFADAIGAPLGLLHSSMSKGNASVGVPEAEVVRRLNELLEGQIEEHQRLHLMRVIRDGLVGRDSAPIAVPASEFDWISQRATELVDELTARGYHVHGSLDDLRPLPGPESQGRVTDLELAEAALAALATVSKNEARLWARMRRRAASRKEAVVAKGSSAKLASQGRAASFKLRTSALEKADDSKVLGWAARTYLKRTSGH